jgi:nitrite reductase/ring-hydroxylating ferredoxin subunit
MGTNKKYGKIPQKSAGQGKPKDTKKMAIAGVLIAIIIVAISVVAVSAGGGDNSDTQNVGEENASNTQSNGPISPTWITAETQGDSVSISKGEIESASMAHFRVPTDEGNLTFMGYQHDGEMHVRANVCPPCRSIGFSLDGDELVCDSCGTTFKAATGAGISGACKAFPKAAVAYEISGDDITMQTADLAIAYENTTEAGWP